MQSIHCKVSCNEQFRRFLFIGTEFSSLFSQVQQLLALDKEFVLKYKDIDGDLITLTSNEELACALSYSDGDILRLVTVPKNCTSDVPVCSRKGNRGRCGRGHGREHMHGGHGHGHGHGYHGWEHMHGGHGRDHGHGNGNGNGHGHGPSHGRGERGHCGWKSEMIKAKILSKRDFFKSQLDELEKVPEKTPEQLQQILRLQNKLKKIECRLEGGWEKETKEKHCEKWAAKKEKRRQKFEKKMKKREMKEDKSSRILSEEAQIQIATLKSQIDLLKPGIKEIKSQIKSKKDALTEAKATGGDPHQLLKEISVLKETRNAQKGQIKPLKQKIYELKYTSC